MLVSHSLYLTTFIFEKLPNLVVHQLQFPVFVQQKTVTTSTFVVLSGWDASPSNCCFPTCQNTLTIHLSSTHLYSCVWQGLWHVKEVDNTGTVERLSNAMFKSEIALLSWTVPKVKEYFVSSHYRYLALLQHMQY